MSDLRWEQPGTVAADFWRVYRDGNLIVDGVVAQPDGAGVRSTPIPGHSSSADYTMTAVNEHGESAQSNVISLPEIPEAIGVTILFVVLLLLAKGRKSSGR